MKIAVTYENGLVFQHFGHSKQFKVYNVTDSEITDSKILDTLGSGHGALAGFLSALDIDTLICGGIGGGAKAALAEAGISVYGGVIGNADTAVKNFIEGHLVYNPDIKCSHHHDGEEHTCSDHGCGSHSCHQ